MNFFTSVLVMDTIRLSGRKIRFWGHDMRVTIETTVYEPEYSSKASVEVPYDDVELSKAFEMCASALEAFGFTGAKKYLEGEE